MGQDPRLTPQAIEDVDLGDLGQSLGFLLRVAQVRVYDQFYDRFGDEDLRPGEFSMLWVMHRNPGIKQGMLAQALRIKPAHMTKTVRRFEDNGLVERQIPDSDRRSVLLRLTDKGEAFVARNRPNFLGENAYNTHDLSEEEAATLARLLRKYNGFEG
ncbi:MarR family winged helix-turn-helix transcriptional regulator [Pseudooceanicola sp. 502str34]|jgi:DNA-binding MarR family transcriptional regulator|uniref:MarR family winged helix-turn-helix transcriptional regulator n=1 Tax=Maritimibacter alkaliphilus TaxID=404236 RepID=UPI001C9681EE|nr:MarR family transcriptional regulator [Maritimibacter alkaliphilus]MBY6089626.1 MarR family transcriptional regulator [Maritimibacter alkaliphilus]